MDELHVSSVVDHAKLEFIKFLNELFEQILTYDFLVAHIEVKFLEQDFSVLGHLLLS